MSKLTLNMPAKINTGNEHLDRHILIEKEDYLSSITLFLTAFLISYLIERKLNNFGVLDQWDVIFDADPVSALSNIANGWGGGVPGFSHPIFFYLFSLPIRAIAKIASMFAASEEYQIRRQLALVVVPLASGLQGSVVFLILRRLNFTRSLAFILTMLGIASFSQLIFGSTPDSFGISSLAIAIGILLMASGVGACKKDYIYWVVLGAIAAGITVTNIVPISIIIFFSLLITGRPLKSALLRTSSIAVISLSITFSLALLGGMVYKYSNPINFENAARTEALRTDFMARFSDFPMALANTILSPKPGIIENKPAILNNHKYKYSFTFSGLPALLSMEFWFSITLLCLIMYGSIRLMQGSSFNRSFAWSLIGIIIYNWLFHSFWGTELFLYSSHWLVPALLLLSGCFRASHADIKLRTALAAITLIFVLINNAFVLGFIFDRLSMVI